MSASNEFRRVAIQSIHNALLLVQLFDNRMRRVADFMRVDDHFVVRIANIAQEVLNRLALLPSPTTAVLKRRGISLCESKVFCVPSTPGAQEHRRAQQRVYTRADDIQQAVDRARVSLATVLLSTPRTFQSSPMRVVCTAMAQTLHDTFNSQSTQNDSLCENSSLTGSPLSSYCGAPLTTIQ